MHQKKSEVQIGTESSGISSDFNPSIHQIHLNSKATPISVLCSASQVYPNPRNNFISNQIHLPNDEKRLFMNPTYLVKSPILPPCPKFIPLISDCASLSLAISNAKAAAFRFLRRLHRLRVHIRFLLLLAFPFFYFLVSNPSRSLILDFLSACAFSAALWLSLNLALPRLPSIRLFLSRSAGQAPLPVFWTIGSKLKSEKNLNSGCWVQAYSNGDVYEGEFHKGKCSGSGVYYYNMSGRYEGDWVNGKYDGYGVETWARGSRYRGQYGQGLRHGFGVYKFYTGDVYAGEWSNGQSHGCGIHTCDDGSRYVGEFKWGVKHGLGHNHFRNGDIYSGEYFADKMHGFGAYKFANGHQYEGAWHESKRQGLGMYTFRNGETQAGHWNNGIIDIPSTQNPSSPVSSVAVNHSKVLNAVQEARSAAKKAYNVSKVDERVNRAVTAANRAANAARVAAVKAVQKQMNHEIHHDNIPIQIL
ncbi:hypothetical protein V2J09_007449 [Rumex salicifolius]